MSKDRKARSDNGTPTADQAPLDTKIGRTRETVPPVDPEVFRPLRELLQDVPLRDRIELRIAVGRDASVQDSREWKEVAQPFIAGRLQTASAIGLACERHNIGALSTIAGKMILVEASLLTTTANAATVGDHLLSQGAKLLRSLGRCAAVFQGMSLGTQDPALSWPLALFELSEPREARRLTAFRLTQNPEEHANSTSEADLATARRMNCELEYVARLPNGRPLPCSYRIDVASTAEGAEAIGLASRAESPITLARFESLVYSSRVAMELLIGVCTPPPESDLPPVSKSGSGPTLTELAIKAGLSQRTLQRLARGAGLDLGRGAKARGVKLSRELCASILGRARDGATRDTQGRLDRAIKYFFGRRKI